MAFCASCGAQMEGRFCAKCGAMVGATAPAPPPAEPPVGGMSAAQPAPAAASSGLSTNGASTLCYLPFALGLLASILFLVLEPYNRNRTVRFHAFQSLFLHVAGIGIWIALSIVSIVLGLIAHFLALLVWVLYPIIGIGFMVLWIVLIVKTYQGSKLVLPVIGPLAEKQAQS
jgi:uncharacterized membrane protein